jgi:hypothetical protein
MRQLPPSPAHAGPVNPAPTSMDLAVLDAVLDHCPFTPLGAYLLALQHAKKEPTMSKRNQNAIAAQQGACNPIPLIRALQDGVEEMKAEDPNGYFEKVRTDPALRLILHQLAYIMGNGSGLELPGTEYHRLCEAVGMPTN